MSRVVVEITAGPAKGKKIVLAAGQILRVGRTEWADFAVAMDDQMSGVHFSLENESGNCYVTDLGSTNGTFINRRLLKPQERVRAAHGAEIVAGRSVFAVRSPSAATDAASATVRRAPGTPDADAVRLSKLPAAYVAPVAIAEQRSFTSEKCNSGVNLYQGSVAEISPSELAGAVSSVLPVYLIVDFKKMARPRPAELAEPSYLFNWMEAEVASLVSPVIVSQDEYLEWPTLIDEGWGSDAVICLFSRQEKLQLVDHLRQALRKGAAGEPIHAIVGYCWPAVLGPLLSYSKPQFVQRLLTGIDAVLIEVPDLPERWQIFSLAEVANTLRQLGFREQPAECEPR